MIATSSKVSGFREIQIGEMLNDDSLRIMEPQGKDSQCSLKAPSQIQREVGPCHERSIDVGAVIHLDLG